MEAMIDTIKKNTKQITTLFKYTTWGLKIWINLYTKQIVEQ